MDNIVPAPTGATLTANRRGGHSALPPLTPSAAMRWDMVSRLLPAGSRNILEIGCGRGGFAVRFAERADHVVALEPDELSFGFALKHARPNMTVLKIMSSDLPENQLFDTVCAFEVLEHIEDDRTALAEWTARLRPGGSLVLSVPAYASRFSHCDVLAGHFRRYDPAHLRRRLDQAGLVDVRIHHYGYPVGCMLEAVRHRVAKRHLAQSRVPDSIESRTAGSGRFLQPDSALMALAMKATSVPAIALQRLFPHRGSGLVAVARKR